MRKFITIFLAVLLLGIARIASADDMPYNVQFKGDWDTAKINIVIGAIIKVSKRIAKLTGANPEDAFNKVYKRVLFRTGKVDDGYAVVNKHIVTIEPENISESLVIHELGHVLANRLNGKPKLALCYFSVYDIDGRFITGSAPPMGYIRNAGRKPSNNGYKEDNYGRYLANPYSNTVSEDWADMFLNWVNNSFEDNKAGDALYSWVEQHLAGWLNN